MSDQIHLVAAKCGEFEPDYWIVKAFESRETASEFAEHYNALAQSIGRKVTEYRLTTPEPCTRRGASHSEWTEWLTAQFRIREEHPDKHSHRQIDIPIYFVQDVPIDRS